MQRPDAGFLGFPACGDPAAQARVVMFGVRHGTVYPGQDAQRHELAPAAIRRASQEDADLVGHWDFDLGGPLFADGAVCCVDAGDLKTVAGDSKGNRDRIEAETRTVLSSNAVPLLFGGDCSVTIPFVKAYAARGPIWILQIDAHIDWRDEVSGERHGYSSPMRRVSEMGHVAGMVQVGLRSVGSARPFDVADALRYGSRFVIAREVHSLGIEAALRHIPADASVVVTLDCDSLDPSIMPGVSARTPGGLSYTQIIDLIAGLGKRARIAGFNLVEYHPPSDIGGISAVTAARILVNVVGAIVRQG